jgi:hypothetical protein
MYMLFRSLYLHICAEKADKQARRDSNARRACTAQVGNYKVIRLSVGHGRAAGAFLWVGIGEFVLF